MGKMNKNQYAITILLLIAALLYNFNNFGSSKPFFDPINILAYCFGGAILVIVIKIIKKPNYCPNCGTRLPRIRIPKNENETLYGWTTCPNCGAEIDNSGQIVNRGE